VKADLRQKLLAQRNALTPSQKKTTSSKIKFLLSEMPVFQEAQKVACYVPFKNEIDTTPIIQALWQTKKLCYLPILTVENSLKFAKYTPQTTLVKNKFNIPEPIDSEQIDLNELDLILMPLVGFDVGGNRLGMGGGYYDRTLQKLDKNRVKPILVGLGYECQKCNSVPVEPWDIAMQAVVTEAKVYYFD
jgi:5-formyltetrahydrofolate cyclo-ligase